MAETAGEGGITGAGGSVPREATRVSSPRPDLKGVLSSEPPAKSELGTERPAVEKSQPVSGGRLSGEGQAAINYLRNSGITDSQIVELLMKGDDIAKFNNMPPEELKAIFGKWNERWIKTFAESYKREDMTFAMAPYWAGTAHTIEYVIDRLTRIATQPNSNAMRSKAEAIFAKAKEGLENKYYRTVVDRATSSFPGTLKPIDTATKEILSASDDFIKKVEASSPDALVEAAKPKLQLIRRRLSSQATAYILPPVSTSIFEETKPEILSTQEDKLVWALLADSMLDYIEKHYAERMVRL